MELHGFLSYLVRVNVKKEVYRVFGYKGKQVRDNIHSYDVARFAEEFIQEPRRAEVYNCGGGRANSCSILEAFALVESISGRSFKWEYVDMPRLGDHICYISDITKMKKHFPRWAITLGLHQIVEELLATWEASIPDRESYRVKCP